MKFRALLLTSFSFLVILAMPFSAMTQEKTTNDAADSKSSATQETTTKDGAETKKEEAPAPSMSYSGDLWSRSTLTGDWWGLRNQLAEKGVTFDLNITQVGQGVVGGGKNGAWQYGGRAATSHSMPIARSSACGLEDFST